MFLQSRVLAIFIFATISSSVDCYNFQPGPYFPPTRGEVWPKAQEENKSVEFFTVSAGSFEFQADKIGCQEFITDALTRYKNMIRTQSFLAVKYVVAKMFRGKFPSGGRYWLNDTNYRGVVTSLDVELSAPCPGDDVVPDRNMIESYELTISATERKLTSSSIWGILRGLETFSQLIYRQEDQLLINATKIRDFPRFAHRGLMIDTSRHFEPVAILLQALDGMSYNKLNVFHWHLTDDFSFPYQSSAFPELTEGAYDPTLVYSPSDVQNIIEYGRRRGIRVIPEFDTPGHTRAWGVTHPELLVACYDNTTHRPDGSLGPMDPTKNSTYKFLKQFFNEIVNVFRDNYIHMGGDEVDFSCWESNPSIRSFMAAHNLTKYTDLQGYFVQNVIGIMTDLPSDAIVWEEVFSDGGVDTPASTLIQVWKGNETDNVLSDVTAAGKTAVFSTCYYLDQLANGGDWSKFYDCEPFSYLSQPDDKQKKLIVGGEACMWGEFVNEYSILQRIFPRVSAVAEKLWSAESATVDWLLAANRMEEHGCRMNNRGLPSQAPTAPGYCV